jgi:hypothetical protein
VIRHPVEDFFESTGLLSHLDEAMKVGRKIIALLVDRLGERSALADAIRDRLHVPAVPRAAVTRLAIEDSKWIVTDVESHAHPFTQKAQFAIADASDHHNSRSFDAVVGEV